MKILKSLFMMIIFMIWLATPAAAAAGGFETEAISDQHTNDFRRNVPLALTKVEPQRCAIDCFSVREDGYFAVACEDPAGDRTVSVYSEGGEFCYAYRFRCFGSIGIEWNSEHTNNINIYFARSDMCIEVSPNGEAESVFGISNTVQNNQRWSELRASRQISGGKIYTARNDGIFKVLSPSAYTKLVLTEPDGTEKTLYKASAEQFLRSILVFIFVILLIGVSLAVLIRYMISLKKRGAVGAV